MKKLCLLLCIILLMPSFSSCTAKEYENFHELNSGSKLQRGSIVYSFYSALPKEYLRGKQIGIVGRDKKHKVFEVNGFSSDEWIIEYYDVIMSVYNLYKADTVTEIPDELKQ
ncbi:hypothetical protein [Defluviitalea saccharophila]|uniref:Uncharacterized protein n=1 Tax=Defluviitalea saccharophila TaxID=879970 RepID=A0ABZ2Y5M4_9FIRM